MKNFKKLFAGITTVLMLAATFPTTVLGSTSYSGELLDAYDYAYANGVTTMDTIDNANMYGSLTRIAMAKMMANWAMNILGLEPDTSKDCSFPDVSSALDAQYDNGVTNACQLGLMGVGITNFDPNGVVTRAQFSTVLSRAMWGDQYDGADPYYADHLAALQDAGVMNDISNPDATEVRGYTMLMMQRADESGAAEGQGCTAEELLACVTASDYDACVAACSETEEEDITYEGSLEISVNENTPESDTLPWGATAVKVFSFDVSAGSEDATFAWVTLTRKGLGASTDFPKVSLWMNGTRIANGKSISASSNAVTFTNLGIEVKANNTETIDVLVDVDTTPTASNKDYFSIVSAADIAWSEANGDFPINWNEMTIWGVSVGKIDVESNGTEYTRKVGETDVELANFTVYVDGTENAEVQSVTLYNAGRDVVGNLELYKGSDKIAEGVQNGDYFSFVLDESYLIEKSQSAKFVVKWDIIDARDTDTATLYIRYNSDVKVVGKTYGYGLQVDVTEGNDAVNSYINEADATNIDNVVTVEAGKLTVAKNGPSTTDVSVNTKNVKLLDFSMTAAQDIDVERFTVTLANTNLLADEVENLKLKCGVVVVGELDAPAIAGDNVFTDNWSLEGWDTTDCSILIDVTNTADGNETITATIKDLTNVANAVFKDGGTQDAITDIIPSGNIAGNAQNVKSASLTIDRGTTTQNDSYTKGTNKVAVASFDLKAWNSADVVVNSIKLTAYAADDGTINAAGEKDQTSSAEDVMSAIYLYNDAGTLLAAGKALTVGTADITVTFDSLSIDIPAGTTKKVIAKADISTTAPLSANNDAIALTIAAVGDVDAEYDDGKTLSTVTLNTNNNTPTVFQTVTNAWTFIITPLVVNSRDEVVKAGSQGVSVAKYELKSINDSFKVKKLTFDIVGGDEDCLNSATLTIGTTSKTETSFANNEVTFTFTNGVEVDGTVEAILSLDFAAMDSNGNNAGDQVQFLIADDNDATETEVVGVGWGNTINDLTDVTDNTINKTYYVRKSDLVFAKQAVSLTKLDDAVDNGELYKFSITNDGAYAADIGMIEIAFAPTAPLVATDITDVWLWIDDTRVEETEGIYNADASFADADEHIVATTYIQVVPLSNYRGLLSAGATMNFKVTADIASADGEKLSVWINTDTTAMDVGTKDADLDGTYDNATDILDNNFVWSDKANPAHTDATLDWLNGYGLNMNVLTNNAFSDAQ